MIITRNVHKLTVWLGALALGAACEQALAVDYHVATAQALQNALTLAAANGANNNIYVTNGYYIGNFNYNSSAGYNLVVTNEPGVTNTQITIDGAGGGRALSITSSGTGAITVGGITFSRNCGSTTIGALRVGAGAGATILVSGCQFLSPTNTSGMGLQLASGLNATVTNCTATGATTGGGGTGISISGVTGNVTLQNCTVTTNGGIGISVSGASVITITGSVVTGNSQGVNCSGPTITISGNTFTANLGSGTPGGGAAYCNGTTVTLSGNTFAGNTSYIGGAAVCNGTTVILSGNTFTGNLANFWQTYNATGGGVACSGGTVMLSGNIFIGNSALGDGGGAYCSGTTIALSGNTFTGNSASAGAGVACSGNVGLTNNTFTGNSATGSGGGAYCSSLGATITVFGNTFQQNNATSGGGMYASGLTINLLDNLVIKNSQTSSSSQGGGIWVNATSNIFMINNTVTGNTAAGSGGGAAFQVTGVVELLNVYNNIIWGNTANGNGGDVWLAGTGQKKVFNFNDADSMYGVWDIALINIDLAPQFFDPVNGDYHIQVTSPCKDAGTNGAPSLPATDLDGGPRIANGTVDLGCYEFSTAATHPADTDTNWVITAAEFNAYAAAWKSGQSWTNGPNPIPANYVTRAGYLMTNGGTYHNDGSARPVNWKTGP